MSAEPVILFHAPQSRSSGTFSLLEELGAPYELKLLNLRAGENRKPEYLAINPMGKVPAIHHRGQLVTEQVAIYLYLADAFPEKGLAPAIGDVQRGPYLRWMVYYAACFEPGMVDRAMKRDAGALAMSPYGDFDVVLKTLEAQLAAGPYMLGERFSAADVLWGSALRFSMMFGIVPENPTFRAYVDRVTARPAFAKVDAHDAEASARFAAAAEA
ncbi:glutathione S-transferase family protein [Phenylobacterium montanum]|uniref:Glutathione S-transferase family protein n=1 Tax=Phenylobacterium montanum TaxID=2823693 RepID=A0A975FZ11_9CAUL|nr:glutathione S-transferase family protein [Caulobacter sp. S6]QUD87880.1 glutathione S-transferase family protein [Caulobacter sp. S6]